MDFTIIYPKLNYKIILSGTLNKVYYIMEKLQYFALSELNENDLEGITIKEEPLYEK